MKRLLLQPRHLTEIHEGAVSVLIAAYSLTAMVAVLPGELPANGLFLQLIGEPLIFFLCVIMVTLHITAVLRHWTLLRKTLFLLDAGVWTAWGVVLYHDRRHYAALYSVIFAAIGLFSYWRFPTRSERSGEHAPPLR